MTKNARSKNNPLHPTGINESLGGDISPQQQIIVDRVSFKVLRCSLIEEELSRYNSAAPAPEYLTKYYLQLDDEKKRRGTALYLLCTKTTKHNLL